MITELRDGHPADYRTRPEREAAVYELLDSLGIPYQSCDHDAAFTMEACREADKALGVEMCKNLFLRNRQGTRYYLLLMPDGKPFKTKELSAQINSARLSFGDGADMERLLGLSPGSVSILGLMNDTGREVTLLCDEDLRGHEYIGCHPCVNTSSLRLKTADVFGTFLKAVGHDVTYVRLTGGEE